MRNQGGLNLWCNTYREAIQGFPTSLVDVGTTNTSIRAGVFVVEPDSVVIVNYNAKGSGGSEIASVAEPRIEAIDSGVDVVRRDTRRSEQRLYSTVVSLCDCYKL